MAVKSAEVVAVLQKQAAKSSVTIKRYKMDNATSQSTICNLEEKVATFDATMEQLKRSHENAFLDLTTTHGSRICSINYQHFSSLLAEKQKLQLCMSNEQQLQNRLYNEVLANRQDAIVAYKSVRLSYYLSSQRLIRMKEWSGNYRIACTMKSWLIANMQELLTSQCNCPITYHPSV